MQKKLNWIIKMEKLVKVIVLFDFFCIIKRIFTNNIFSMNASLLQKLKNTISSHTFQMGEQYLKGPSIYHMDNFSPLLDIPPPPPPPPPPQFVHVDIFYENIDIIDLQKQRGQTEWWIDWKFGIVWEWELKQGFSADLGKCVSTCILNKISRLWGKNA